MRTVLFIIIFILSIAACSNGTLTKEEINAAYIEKATTFINASIKDGEAIQSLLRIDIDTISILSTQGREFGKMQPLMNEMDAQAKLTQKLLDIDKEYGLGTSSMTDNAIAKYTKMNDSLQNWIKVANELEDKDTLGYTVIFTCDFQLKNGTNSKGLAIPINYDKQGDIRKEWNPQFK